MATKTTKKKPKRSAVRPAGSKTKKKAPVKKKLTGLTDAQMKCRLPKGCTARSGGPRFKFRCRAHRIAKVGFPPGVKARPVRTAAKRRTAK